MTTATTDSPRLFHDRTYRFGARGARPSPLTRSDGGRLTLEQRLDGVWEGLTAGGRAVCPVCTADMGRTGICSGCGSRLA